jgi:formate dehydrogenase major subunit
MRAVFAANHLTAWMPKDESNPYFTFDPSKCIVCSRCVRACEEVQGTFALTIEGRGFDSKVSPGMTRVSWLRMRLLRRLRAGLPDRDAEEKSVIEIGQPEHSVVTTCAYCGVGCSFKAEMRGDEVVRMVPYKDGKANRGHSCVKGRFAWGYATHKDRILKPMIREKITDPWREVSWDEAINYAAAEFKRIQAKYGRDSIGGITSSRCTNEETYLVQKLVRAGFGNNNVDTCARVCHSPTGYGLKTDLRHLGRHAGLRLGRASRRDHGDRRQPDRRPSGVRLAHEEAAAPGRQADRHRSAPHRPGASPHIEADYHLPLMPGTNVAVITRWRMSSSPKGLVDEAFVASAATGRVRGGREFVAEPRELAGSDRDHHRRAGRRAARAARLYATGGNGAIYYGLGVTEHSQGSTMVMGIANLAMATGNIGREGVGVNPLRGQNNVQGSCDMGSFPHELPGYRHVSDDAVRDCSRRSGASSSIPSRACASPTCSTPRSTAPSRASTSRARTSLQSDPTPARRRGAVGDGMRRRAGPVPQRDRELRARVPAGLVLPGEGRHLHQRRAPHLSACAR